MPTIHLETVIGAHIERCFDLMRDVAAHTQSTSKTRERAVNINISGAADDQIRPEWEQSAARRVLGVKPIVITCAGHANILTQYAAQLADAVSEVFDGEAKVAQ